MTLMRSQRPRPFSFPIGPRERPVPAWMSPMALRCTEPQVLHIRLANISVKQNRFPPVGHGTAPRAPKDLGETENVLESLRAGETWSGEILLRRRDGTTFPAHVSGGPLHVGPS